MSRNFPAPVRYAFVAMLGVLNLALLFILIGSRDASGARVESSIGVPIPQVTAELTGVRLPVEVNESVDLWIDRFIGQDRASFENYLVREGLYGELIRDRLRSREMPEELLYLAMIESGFSTTAISKVSAAGVWQFMGPTARQYGLTVDYWVDERRDPVRATDAALDYLEVLYAEFGSWHLAAAAYNAGPGFVRRTLARLGASGRTDEDVYWEISDHLPRETREYVPRLLAATVLARQAEAFGFDVEKSLPYLFDQVLVPAGTRLADVADALEVERGLIRELNPHLLRGMTPPDRALLVRVPIGDSERLVASFGEIL